LETAMNLVTEGSPREIDPIAALFAIGVCFHTDIKLLRIMAKCRPFRRHPLAMPRTGGLRG
jgi:hypothetical protein